MYKRQLIEGRNCSGEGVEKLRKGIEDYLSGNIAFEAFVEYVVKVYASRISCGVAVAQTQSAKETAEKYTPQGTAFLKLIPANDLSRGAKIYIDGKYAGKIEGDLFSIEISAGKHKVLVTNEKIKDIEFEFEVGEYEEYEKEIEAKPATRVVKIISDPSGAALYVDGKKIGTTPKFVKLEVEKNHVIILDKEGYERFERKLYISQKGDVLEKVYKLRLAAVLKVESIPKGADVYLEGKLIGKTPLIYKVAKEIKGMLVVKKIGYLKEEVKVNVKLGKEIKVKTKLSMYKLKWKFRTSGKVFSSPAIGSDGTIYVGSDDGYLYAINPDGSLKWRFKTDGEKITSSPVIGSDGTIYAGFTGKWDYWLYAISLDGQLKWKVRIRDVLRDRLAIGHDGTIYVAPYDVYLYAINPNGELKWKVKIPDGALTSPAIGHDGTIYVGCEKLVKFDGCLVNGGGYQYAIDPYGRLKWKLEKGLVNDSDFAIGFDGTIYMGVGKVTHEGEITGYYLYAINPDGSLKWRFKTGSKVRSSPAIGSDGTIYVGSDDGCLYAIATTSGGPANSPWPMFHHDPHHTGRYGYEGWK